MIKYAEAIATLTKTVQSLESKVEELEPYRLEVQRLAEEKAMAELQSVKDGLTATAKSIVGENELTAEMASAIENADEKALKVAIAEYVIANVVTTESTIKVAEKTENVIISTSDSDYTIEKS